MLSTVALYLVQRHKEMIGVLGMERTSIMRLSNSETWNGVCVVLWELILGSDVKNSDRKGIK